MNRVLYIVAVACAIVGFVNAANALPGSRDEAEAASLLVLAALLAVAGWYAARQRPGE